MTTATDRRIGTDSARGIKAPCLVATTANITLSGLQTIDGVLLVLGNRVLVRSQTDAKQNGIYTATTSAWPRAADFDSERDISEGTMVRVTDGTVWSGAIFRVTNSNPIVIDTTEIAFADDSALTTVSSFMETLLDDTTAADARTTLGAASDTFIQSGTGAVSTTLQTRIRRIEINSWDFMTEAERADVISGAGTLDVTAAVQAAINEAAILGVGVKNPPGRLLISDTLVFPSIGSIPYVGPFEGAGSSTIAAVLNGSDLGGTIFTTGAGFAKPLFKFISSRDLKFKGFTAQGPGKTVSGSIAFHFDLSNTGCKLEDIVTTGWETTFQNGDTSYTDTNDDIIHFYNVKTRETTYVVRSYNSQAYMWEFYGCDLWGDNLLRCETDGNKIRLFGGFVNITDVIFDVEIGGGYGQISCTGTHFETPTSSGGDPPQLIKGFSSANAVPGSISFDNCEMNWEACDYTTSVTFIEHSGSGPLKFTGCNIRHPNPRIDLWMGSLGSGGIGNAMVAIFSGNSWYWEPIIRRPDTGVRNNAQFLVLGDGYQFYNKKDAQGNNTSRHSGYIIRKIGGYPNAITEYLSDSLPTAGTYLVGDKIFKMTVAAGGSPGWVNTANGTFSSATDNTGDTDGTTAVITGLTDTSDFIVGEYVTVSAGFPSSSTPMQIIDLTASAMTLDTNSNSAQSNVTVATVDPVFKAMASVAA